MRNKNENKKESYNTIEEAVLAIFVNKKNRKRMFMVLFLLSIVGAVIILTGTHFLLKQQSIIEQNKDIDWRNEHAILKQLKLSRQGNEESIDYLVNSEMARIKTDNIDSKVEMFFVGDLMLDRYNRQLIQMHGAEWITKEINHLFLDNDLNVVNLEGPITREKSVSVGSKEGAKNNYVFTFDPKNTNEFLKYNKLNLINLGNNHVLNFGKDGLDYTKGFLLTKKVEFFGDIKNEGAGYIKKNINGTKVSFVSYNQFGGNGFDSVLKNIENLEESSDITIVYTHWGQEYKLNENESQKKRAHNMIDVGADLIIGSHPHVVQSIENYKGKTIFYSLGNFVFDQYFSKDTMIGLGVKAFVDKENDLTFELIPLELTKGGQMKISGKEENGLLMKRILKK